MSKLESSKWLDGKSCEICGKRFDTSHGASIHRANAHSDDEVRNVMIEALQIMAEEIGRTPYAQEMEEDGPFSSNSYQNRFGSWNEAIEAADLERHRVWGGQEVECLHCGETFRKQHSNAENHDQHFCDSSCMGNWQSERFSGDGNPRYIGLTTECDYCGKEFATNPRTLERTERQYCDQTCRSQWRSENRSGEDSPLWEGTTINNYGADWKKQRSEARKRDDYRCQGCGLSEEKHWQRQKRDLHVHHVKPYREFADPADANKLENLVTLCSGCHPRWEGIPVAPRLLDEVGT